MTGRADDNARRNGPPRKKAAPAPGGRLKPHWNPERRELTLGGKLVKRFRQPADNQIAVIEAFQLAGWPASIADPLPPDPCVVRHQFRDTIKGLNRYQKEARIIFGGDGTKSRVLWRAGTKTRKTPAAVRGKPRRKT